MQCNNYYPLLFNASLEVPYCIYAAGYVQADRQFHEFVDGRFRDYCGFFWCKSGHATFGIHKKRFPFSPGQATHYLPHYGHSIASPTKDFSYYWITLGGPEAERTLKAFHFPDQAPFDAGLPPEDLYDKLFASMNDLSVSARYRDPAIVLEILLTAAQPKTLSRQSDTTSSGLLNQFKDIVVSEYANPELSLSSLSERLHVHRTTITRTMKKEWGILPSEYIEVFRIQRAMQKLTDINPSVSQVAFDCGFSDPAYFCRRFKIRIGRTPSEYKNSKYLR